MEERIKKAALVMQSERALQEIVLLRDVYLGEVQDRLEDAWRQANTVRQELLDSMRPEAELALERYRPDVRRLANRTYLEPIPASEFIPTESLP